MNQLGGCRVQQQSNRSGLGTSGDAFGHTRWSLVAALRDGEVAPDADPLSELCRGYWYPAYAFLRRSGLDPSAAQFRCRQFFASLAADIRTSNPASFGRFRVFLFDRLQHFVATPGVPPGLPALPDPPLSLDELEERLAREHLADAAPASAFERSFGLQVLSRSRERLRNEIERSGRQAMFERLAPFLTMDPSPSAVAELSQALGIGTLALQVAVKRLRQRFRELVETELAETVASSADLEAERAALLRVLAGKP